MTAHDPADAPLASAPPAAPLATFDTIDQTARAYAEASRSAATRRAYAVDWRHFTTWCEEHAVASLPATPATIVRYLAATAGRYAVATLTRRLASISQAHQLAGHPSPTQSEHVRTTMKGIRRTNGAAQRQVAAATTDVLKAMLETLPDTLAGRRDRALLLLGFTGALRRS
jgi:site-specific recombinase XerD